MKTPIPFAIGSIGLLGAILAAASCGSDGGGAGGRGGSSGGAGRAGAGGRGGGAGGGLAGTGAGGTSDGTGGSDAGVDPACKAAQYTHSSLFGSSFDAWGVPAGNPTFALAPMPGVDGGPPTGTLQSLDTTEGSPAPGSAKLEIPFSDTYQQLLFAQNYPTPVNLAGTTITAQIKLDSGLIGDPVTSVARAFLVIKSTPSYSYATGVATTLDTSAGWTTLTINVDAPSGLPFVYNPCDVREIDVEIDTGQQGTYKPAVVHIDTITITGSANVDASTGN